MPFQALVSLDSVFDNARFREGLFQFGQLRLIPFRGNRGVFQVESFESLHLSQTQVRVGGNAVIRAHVERGQFLKFHNLVDRGVVDRDRAGGELDHVGVILDDLGDTFVGERNREERQLGEPFERAEQIGQPGGVDTRQFGKLGCLEPLLAFERGNPRVRDVQVAQFEPFELAGGKPLESFVVEPLAAEAGPRRRRRR